MTRTIACISLAMLVSMAPRAALGQTDLVESARTFPLRMLAAHNAVRQRAGVPPLVWDNELGSEAAKYAFELAVTGRFEHSAPENRRGAGENLWMGSRGGFTTDAMVNSWASERRLYKAGVFPNVSRSGSWHEIGHYTQMVWPTTQRVGCALATNATADYLVCRYWPAGNVYGTVLRVR